MIGAARSGWQEGRSTNQGGCMADDIDKQSGPFFERTGKRRKGFPSETQVKRW